jgi:hypothetical protein
MKALFTLSISVGLLAGCASTGTGHANRSGEGARDLDDQPQTSVAGEGSLMPGAYGSRAMERGQFTGQERTNAQVGQRPTLPREADARELAHDSETERGAGTLGQSGIVPGEPVTGRTLIEQPAPPGAPAHSVVIPPGSEAEALQREAAGAPAPGETGDQTIREERPE